MLFIYGGAANNFSSLHIKPVSEALGISRTTFSLIYSIKSIMAMLASYFSGAILKKFGFRATASFFLIVSTASYIVLSMMNASWILALICFAMGAASSFCGTTGATIIISAWFHRHRGTVLGFVSAATGLGGSVMCIAQSAAMERFTWRGSFALCAISCGMASIAVVLYTVAIPLVTITVPLLAFSLFGYKAQTQYTGVFISVIYAASFLSSPLCNLIHDTLGSYRPAYYLAAILLAIDVVLYLALYKSAKLDNQKRGKV